jgi:hypothetical protein
MYGPMHQFALEEMETRSLCAHKREDRSLVHSFIRDSNLFALTRLHVVSMRLCIFSFLASPAMCLLLLLLPCPRRHLVTFISLVEVPNLGRRGSRFVLLKGTLIAQSLELELLVETPVCIDLQLHSGNAVQSIVSYTDSRTPRAPRLTPTDTGCA